MKTEIKVGKFTTDNGNTYEIKEIITNTMLNKFCDEAEMYSVEWIDQKMQTFSERGIRSIIKNS